MIIFNFEKISYNEFDKYLQACYPQANFYEKIVPQMRKIALFAVKSVYGKINPLKRDTTFEVEFKTRYWGLTL